MQQRRHIGWTKRVKGGEKLFSGLCFFREGETGHLVPLNQESFAPSSEARSAALHEKRIDEPFAALGLSDTDIDNLNALTGVPKGDRSIQQLRGGE